MLGFEKNREFSFIFIVYVGKLRFREGYEVFMVIRFFCFLVKEFFYGFLLF